MIKLEPREKEHLPAELEIMNSNPDFNLISCGKPHLTEEDLRKEREEGKAVDAKRFMIKQKNQIIGIIEYCPLNPNDGKPWIGLFIIHRDVQGKGLAKLAYETAEEELLSVEGFSEVRLGVLTNNERGNLFWQRMGYTAFKEGMYENRPIYHYEKKIKQQNFVTGC
ncbi:GNAT family N-acetyltransferase [Peribacillus frigoritolerans]|uniref:GNAT family N-acetyltransferase n=1 Tax=Peribacillus frigoritolerans TaxID=450367 RepID=UPI0010594E92|nr:GNAT family N-acetyltransferase [Peribacillus frigoritolerans]TDL80242.1 GNAT family N-acetyltransferase [Peribacillus frigoritolerans]